MEGFYINVPFFLIPVIAVFACAIVALVVEAIAGGNGGKVTYVFTFIVALVGAFLAIHWDYLDHRTIGDLVLHGALASTIVMGLLISAIGSWLGKLFYAKCVAAASPAWLKDDEGAAIKAVSKEQDRIKLEDAASNAKSYRARSIALKKLGRQHEAKVEIALHAPEEATCLAALDEIDWDGRDQSLATIALNSTKEAVAVKALSMIRDEDMLANVACKASKWIVDSEPNAWCISDFDARKTVKTRVAAEAIGRLENTDTLRGLDEREGFDALPAVPLFEKGKQHEDCEVCAAALGIAVTQDADNVPAMLATIDDADFLKEVVVRWLETAEKPTEILEKLNGKAIVEPTIARGLGDYFCPDGCLHDLEDASYHLHAGTDEMFGSISCKRCGYDYTVDERVQRLGKNCGYMFRPASSDEWLMTKTKHVRCRPGGYRCISCKEFVQPDDEGHAPSVCPNCGTER
jgi:hypothetical protein